MFLCTAPLLLRETEALLLNRSSSYGIAMPPPMAPSPIIDPMDDGEAVDMLTPEEESLVVAREFGKNDRLNKEAKQARLKVLNSPFPTLDEMKAVLDGLAPSAGKGLLEMATFLHDELDGLFAEERAVKVTKLSFALDLDDEDQVVEGKARSDAFVTKPASQGPQSAIGVLLMDRPEVLGFPGRCVVHGSVPGSPAYFSGKIRQGDLIMQVDEEDVTPDNVVKKMRGNDVPGTRIKLLVDRVGRKRPFAVHLIRVLAASVAQKRAVFGMLGTLAQAAGAGPLEQSPDLDDSNTALHRELIARLKLFEREKVDEEVTLREQSERKDRALYRAQLLVQEFLSKGRELLSSEAKDKSSVQKVSQTSSTVGLLSKFLGGSSKSAEQPAGHSSENLSELVSRIVTLEAENIILSKQVSESASTSIVPVAPKAAHVDHASQKELAKALEAVEILKESQRQCETLATANGVLTASLDEANAVLQELRGEIQQKSQVVDSLHERDSFKDAVRLLLPCLARF